MSRLRVALVGLRADRVRPQVPLALGYMKAMVLSTPELRDAVDVEIVEAWHGEPTETLAARVSALRPAVIGYSAYIWNVAAVTALSRTLRERLPAAFQIVGGPEVTPRAETYLRATPVDIVVDGEGEETFKELLLARLSGADLASVRGIVYRRGSEIAHTEHRPLLETLDLLPSPYLEGVLEVADGAEVPLETSRGCQFKCRFCTWATTGLRSFSPERVLRELEAVSAKSKKVFLQVISADSFEDPREAETLLGGMRAAGRGTDWIASVETHLGHWKEGVPEWLNDERYHLFAGVQTTNPDALKVSARFFNRAKNDATVAGLKKTAPKASVHLELILGMPGDSLDGFRGSMDWALSADPTTILVYRLLMLHGSTLRERAVELGIRYVDEPPYLATSVPGFEGADLVRAHFLSYAVGLFRSDPVLRPALQKLGAARAARGLPLPYLSVIEDLLAELERRPGFKPSKHYYESRADRFTSFDDVLWIDRQGRPEHEAGRPAWLCLEGPARAEVVRALASVAAGVAA